MDNNLKKEQYDKLLKLVCDLKLNLQKQIDDIDELYDKMVNGCSINETPLDNINVQNIKNQIVNDIDFIDSKVIEDINEKLSTI